MAFVSYGNPPPVHARPETRESSHIARIHYGKRNHVVQPILAVAIRVLRGNRECVVLPRQQAIEPKLDLECLARAYETGIRMLNARVGAKDVDSQPIANQDPDYRIIQIL